MKNKFALTRLFVCSTIILLFSSIAYSQDCPCAVFPTTPSVHESQSIGVLTLVLLELENQKETFFLRGPSYIENSDVKEDPLGTRYVETEIVSLDLRGDGSLIPSLEVTLRETEESTGTTTDDNPDPSRDFPADSFFDIFLEVTGDFGTGIITLHNEEPLHVYTETYCIPSVGMSFQNPIDQIVLYTPLGDSMAIITNAAFKPENPIFSVRPEAYLHNNSLGPLEFTNRTFFGAAIAEPNFPGTGWPPIGRIVPPLLGLVDLYDNLDALSFGDDYVNPELVNYTAVTFSVDPASMGAPLTAVNFEFAIGTSYGPPDLPAPPEQVADIFYSPINMSNILLYDEKDPTCINLNMTVTNFSATNTNCPQPWNPPGWPGGDDPEDTDALEMNNIFFIGEDTVGNNLIDILTNNVFFSIDATSASNGQSVQDFRPPPVDGITSPDDILTAPPPGTVYGIYASGVLDIGLVQGDDLDALCLLNIDYYYPGFLDPGVDMALFSLAPGSPSLGAGFSAADIFFTNFIPGPLMLYTTAVSLGLIFDDNLDAMDCQCLIDTIQEMDFGDAPDLPYPTLLPNGARHIIDQTVYLGSLIDSELDGQPNSTATGDDISNLADEDGVAFLTPHHSGGNDFIIVTASKSGYLNVWCDFNADGDWDDPGEQIFMDTPLNPGGNPLTYIIPDTAVTDTSFIRFRFSTWTGLGYDGLAQDGEVEDYRYLINDHVVVPSDTVANGDDTCYTALNTITIPVSGGKYLVENGGSLIAIAGVKISVKPGFTSESGSYASLSIGNPVCPPPPPSPAPPMAPLHDDEPIAIDKNETVIVYPNPTTGIVNIRFSSEYREDMIHVEVFSLVGQTILSTTVPGREELQLDLSTYPRGIDIFKLLYNNKTCVKKLIKE